MKKILTLIVFLGIFFSISKAEYKKTIVNSSSLFNYPTTVSVKSLKNQDMTLAADKNIKPILLNTSQVASLFNTGYSSITINNFPVSPEKNANVVLNRSESIINSSTWFRLGTKNGIINLPPIQVQSYSGYIDGKEDSKVYVTYTDGLLFSIIDDGEGNEYNINPVLSQNSKDTPHILSSPTDTQLPPGSNPFVCLTKDYNGPNTEQSDDAKRKDYPLSTSTLLQAGIICEGTSQYYQMMNSNETLAESYMAAVVSVSSKIYEDNLNVKIVVNGILIWQDKSDPYSSVVLLSDKLDIMPSQWATSSDKRAIVVLFDNLYAQQQNSSYYVAGISKGGAPNTGSLCSNVLGYCACGIEADGNGKYPTTNYTWDVNVVAHEMGHNFSCPHTHNCYFDPQIDTCITIGNPLTESDACQSGQPIPRLGTLMSYCHLTNAGLWHSSVGRVQLFFSPREVKLMRTASEHATCLKAPSEPTLKLLSPLGEATYGSGQTVQVRWVFSGISYIGIKFSSDNENTWNIVQENIPVTDSIYNWTVPNIPTTQGKIWIYNMTDPSVGDTSWRTFTINTAYLAVTNPQQGGKYSHNSPIIIQWNATLVQYVDIDYSTDGGGVWNPVATRQTGGQYNWDVTNVISNDCKIRLKNSDDPTFTAESGTFAIGYEKISILSPKDSAVWCGGYNYKITWSSDFVDRLFIDYSLDNGLTWIKVKALPTDASIGYLSWKLPVVTSTNKNVRLRTYSFDNKDSILFVTKPFTIDTCELNGVNDQPDYPTYHPLQILEIVPNPTDKVVTVRILDNINSINPVQFLIYDEKGAEVCSLGSYSFNSIGEQSVQLQLPQLSVGNYFLTVQSGNYRFTKSIVISR